MAASASAYREGSYSGDDGLGLKYRDYGDAAWPATPVVCLAGLTRNAADFDDLARHLAETGRRVVVPDYRGRGRSTYGPDWRNYRAEVHLGDVEALLSALNLRRVVIIGTSFGGLLGMALAATRPAALAGVVLNDVGPEINADGLARIAGYIGIPVMPASWEEAALHLMDGFSPIYPDLKDDDWMKMARATFRQNDDGRITLDYDLNLGKALAEAGPPEDMWPIFGALKDIPALAIRGGLSDILSQDVLTRMAEVKPDLKIVTLDNRGHVPLLDEPQALDAIDDFLNAL